MTHPQLTLEFAHRTALGGEDFLVARSNAQAVAWLDRWREWPSALLVVHGPPASGKTHLARVFAAETGARAIAAADLIVDGAPARLAHAAPALVIDDADTMMGADLEEPLLHLVNALAESGCRLLLTAARPPARWPVRLPDLGSRLRAAPVVAIGAPDDALIAAVLVKHFADRQLKVEADVVGYMVKRMERSMEAARELVAAIDALALAERRNVTVPLVRRAIGRTTPE